MPSESFGKQEADEGEPKRRNKHWHWDGKCRGWESPLGIIDEGVFGICKGEKEVSNLVVGNFILDDELAFSSPKIFFDNMIFIPRLFLRKMPHKWTLRIDLYYVDLGNILKRVRRVKRVKTIK